MFEFPKFFSHLQLREFLKNYQFLIYSLLTNYTRLIMLNEFLIKSFTIVHVSVKFEYDNHSQCEITKFL